MFKFILIIFTFIVLLKLARCQLVLIKNDFEKLRRIETVYCNDTVAINNIVDCICPNDDCIYCDYGQIMVKDTLIYCKEVNHEVYYNVLKSEHHLEKETRIDKSFIHIGRVENANDGFCNGTKNNRFLGNNSSNPLDCRYNDKIMVVLGAHDVFDDSISSKKVILLSQNGEMIAQIDFTGFRFETDAK